MSSARSMTPETAPLETASRRKLPDAVHPHGAEKQQIITADGATLHTERHRPTEETPRGDVLIRTPYGLAHQRGMAASLTARGFRCWLQDVRGTSASSGVFDPYRTEADDGLVTVRHILAQQNRSGPLMLMGSSYGATCALEAARTADHTASTISARRDGQAHMAKGIPAIAGVIAIVPTIGRGETAHAMDGTPRVRDRFGWWHQYAFTRHRRAPLSNAQLDTLTREAAEHGPRETARRRNDLLGWPPEQMEAWDEMWRQEPISLEDHFGESTAPLLVISGERDFFADRAEPLRAAWGCRTTHQDSTLITGPWGHSLKGRDPNLRSRIDRWIDTRLRPRPNGPHEDETHERTR